MATESRVTTEGSHPFSTGLDLCLVHNGSLSNHNRLREQPAARGDRVPDRERHRGRRRLPRLAAARGRVARAGARGLPRRPRRLLHLRSSARRTASPCCATRSPASRPCSPRPTTGSRWRPSTARSRCCPAPPTRSIWEPEPARRLRLGEGSGRVTAVDAADVGRGRRPRGDVAARAEPAPARPRRRRPPAPRRWRVAQPERRARGRLRARRRARGRDRRARRLLLRRDEQARDGARARQRRHRRSPRT